MQSSTEYLNASEAARRLGVSAKALRLYEQRGLVTPLRTEAGWRVYGPRDMAQCAEIAALRELGLGLAHIGRVLAGDTAALAPALVAHQAVLEARIRALASVIARVRDLRADLANGQAPGIAALTRVVAPPVAPVVAFDLPWPWGGERFEIRTVRALNYIIGPLGCGKTRLALHLAEAWPASAFLGLDRLENGSAHAKSQLAADPALKAAIEAKLSWLVQRGAVVTDALLALLIGFETSAAMLVIDMIEEGLDEPTQRAVMADLRRRGAGVAPLFILTRSSAVLTLADVGADEAIILCPANHSPPSWVSPHPGSPGYEAVATSLASPTIRARTHGTIAWRPNATERAAAAASM